MDGAGDPERKQALEDYKKCLLESREWEAKLKSLRLGIKDLQKEFDTTEENIKALQSVGQIIGEVLKQLDEERCECCLPLLLLLVLKLANDKNHNSHRQGLLGTQIRRRLPIESRQVQAQARHPRDTGHDDPDYYAHAASRS